MTGDNHCRAGAGTTLSPVLADPLNEVAHRNVDHGFGAVGAGLVVTGASAVVHEPAEGPLDCEASGMTFFESLDAGGALDDFDVDAEAGAVVNGFGAAAGVGPCLGHAGLVVAM
ncbi:hypothetical protein N4G66_43455 [Streptomyces rhizosphaerihabitans]|nr:hypothetical protein [Streptomyces rhizosphaerihabitans]